MRSTSPAVLLRRLSFLGISLILLFNTSCTSRRSFPDMPTPARQSKAKVIHVLAVPTVKSPATRHSSPSLAPSALFTSTPSPMPATATSVPLPSPTPTSIPVIPTTIPTQSPTQAPTAIAIPAASAPAIPTRIIIPSIGLDASVMVMGWSVVERNGQQVSEWDVPAWRAVGWLKTSALLGSAGNTVMEGHQNIYGRVFENLQNVQEGDMIQVYADALVRNYIVTLRIIVAEKNQPMEVRLKNAEWIAHKEDERLTLITCYPNNSDTHRLILVAYPQL